MLGSLSKLVLLVVLCVWALAPASASAASLTSKPFGKTADGKRVRLYTMTSGAGVRVSFMNYGGVILDVTTPDKNGHPGPIVLGFPTLHDYETTSARSELYFGALIGRYANWIDRGRFSLHGHAYQITLSDPPQTIHGGKVGFDKRLWRVEPQLRSGKTVSALLTYTSPDGEEGFPGTVKVRVTYSLSDEVAFTIMFEAVADADTVINLTSHMNFNLAGAGSGDVLAQVLTVNADKYLPLNRAQLPLGEPATVDKTPFDFRKPTPIGARIHENNPQLAIAQGYDQYWILKKRGDATQPQPAAYIYDPATGRTLDCFTTEPGVQIYTGSWLTGPYAGIGGFYKRYGALTLETQHFPDSPNHANFPTTELRRGQVFKSTTIFRFGVQK